jgi:hypothetical protein
MMILSQTGAVRLFAGLFVIVWVLLLSQQIYYYFGVFLSLVCAVYGVPVIKRLLYKSKAARFALIMAVFTLVWIVVGSMLFGTFDTQFYTRIFYFYFNVVSAAGIAYLLIRFAKFDCDGAIRLIWLAFFIYGLLNIFALIYQPFQHASLLLFRMDEYTTELFERQPYRFFGLAGFNGFGVSLIYPLLITLVLNSAAKKTALGIGAVCLFVVVGLFSSRIAGILCLLVTFLLVPPKLKVAMILIFCVAVIYVLSIIEDSETLKWAFEMLNSYVNGEGLVTESSNILFQRMYFTPDSWITIVLGDFHFVNSDGTYYGNTDAGFMRMMLFFGIFGSALFYLSFIGISLLAGRKHIFLLTGIMIFSEVKGDAILASPASKIYMLIVFVSLGIRIASKVRYSRANAIVGSGG